MYRRGEVHTFETFWTQGNAFNRDIDDSEYFSTAAELFTNLEHVLNHCYQGVIELLLAAINPIPE